MKNLLYIALMATAVVATAFTETKKNENMSTNIYDYTINSIDGNEIKLSSFKGKKILFVNVASECGFTPQYKELEQLHEKYKDKLVVIGFPCNQFGGQEPGTHEEIKNFCEKNYGVTFLITEKIDVKGDDQHPIYKWLTSKDLNGVDNSSVKWNFQKYLVDEEGHYVEMFLSTVTPMSDKITGLL